ncbi:MULTISPECIES: ABC transporter ATP-binding protein [Streptomyces]|uniref:ABC transporter ATP-binding protein n=1 Tax=Streptomyces TaxID=1883 RepID=UPI00017EAD85|nr:MULTISPECIES: ATP-binding cassette domain-containing protein [Streptomyces]AKL68723.1 multidrug ABC transporter ATP-binding protein [Streptomyces sp. Mg1]EDX24122.1 ABC transporter ATP-binding protein [Streptomyces sp. Mg1]RPK35464.1 Daunorubicin/doxorubicin resistance ATP-binding protein DrrA [Streptomyces sp. ADI91-18]WBY22975.1 ATP-binding cassette domain-containing protein [Streptomyces goshikiensis]
MNSIEIRELTKEYGRARAVDHLTFDVLPGRVTGFLGPNGAGKSTTMRLLLGLDRATSGTATIGGQRFTDFPDPLHRVGALLDAQAAHGGRTARAHLSFLAAANRIPARRVEEVLERSGIASAAKRRIKTFSLGMRQRLGIAAALLGDPGVLLLDEPTNGLDPEGIIWVRELMRTLAAEGRTILVSSHLMSETAAFADHLVVLGQGKLLADTSMEEFIDARSTPRVRLRTSDPVRLRAALAREGLEMVGADDGRWTVEGIQAERLGPLAAREGIPMLELSDERASLEQAYLDLTADHAQFAATR